MSQLDIVRAIQSIHSPLLDQLFGLMTNLHHETVYVLIVPLIYWLYDKRFGRYMFSVFALGLWTNDFLKDLFHTVRPSPEDVRVLLAETGGGFAFPSGHSQTPLIFWGAVAAQFRRPWFTWFVGLVVFLIGFSRLYLGLHWPLDVLGGWAIGLVILWLLERTRPFWVGEHQALVMKLALAALVPVGALVTTYWLTPTGMEERVWTVAGVYAGLLAGSALEEKYIGFNPRAGSPRAQVVKILVGLVLLLAVKEGLKLLLPETGLGNLVRYFAVALGATLGAPWLFRRFLGGPPAQELNTSTRG